MTYSVTIRTDMTPPPTMIRLQDQLSRHEICGMTREQSMKIAYHRGHCAALLETRMMLEGK